MERLSKYNYFDDDFDDYEERPSKFHFRKIEAADVQETLTNFLYGARERALERLTSTASPESRRARISFSAGIAVLIAASIIITCVVFSAELKKANTVSSRYYSAAGEVCTQLLTAQAFIMLRFGAMTAQISLKNIRARQIRLPITPLREAGFQYIIIPANIISESLQTKQK